MDFRSAERWGAGEIPAALQIAATLQSQHAIAVRTGRLASLARCQGLWISICGCSCFHCSLPLPWLNEENILRFTCKIMPGDWQSLTNQLTSKLYGERAASRPAAGKFP